MSFQSQQHQKLLLKRNIASSKNSRYHNSTHSGYKNHKYKLGNLIQQRSAISSFHSTGRIKIYPYSGKKLIFCKSNTRSSVSSNIKSIYRKLKTADKLQNFINHSEIQINFSWDVSAGKYSCNPNTESERKSYSREGNFQNVKLESHCGDRTLQRHVYQQSLFCQ